ncbi:MAG: hypothetical protein GC161_13085 [Planctomycetaceae bacterium]|nr:hypothetical protein [Planctomycetaceae bacterium]
MQRLDDFLAWVKQRKAEVWAEMLSAEPPRRSGAFVGRRPRDPEKEALLLEIDRYRVERSELLSAARKVPAQTAAEADERTDDRVADQVTPRPPPDDAPRV